VRIIFNLLLSTFLFSQCPPDTTGYQVLKDLTICFTKVESAVSYHQECNCYYYTYNIISPENNKGKIHFIYFQFETEKYYSPYDNTLPRDPNCDLCSQRPGEIQKWIPLSVVSCPEGWSTGRAASGIHRDGTDNSDIFPGTSGTFTIATKFPPGRRKLTLKPYDYDLLEYICDTYFPDSECFYGEIQPPFALANNFYSWKFDVIGPVCPDDLELFNGGGQKPDDVNLFLRYGNPTKSQTELPEGESSIEIFIYYGKTIKKETFQAKLNSIDIKNLFYPVPGGGDYVKLNLQKGRNVLVFSVDGINERGKVSTDTDRLTVVVK